MTHVDSLARARGRPRGLRRLDATHILTVYVVLLICIPSALVFAPIGASGTPANLLGIAMLAWWCIGQLVPGLGAAKGHQPVRLAIAIVLLAVLLSYATAMLHGWAFPVGTAEKTTPATPDFPENVQQVTATAISAADRGLISFAAWAGVALLVSDGLRTRAEFLTVLRRLVYVAAAMATLGIAQFFTGFDVAHLIHIPGLKVNVPYGTPQTRSIFHRVVATAIHPIEFGVVLAACLPLALHFALHAPEQRRRLAWICVILIGIAVPMSVSRSAILVGVVAYVITYFGWSRRRRFISLLVVPFAIVALRLMIPGLVGTIRSLFVNISSDPSTTGRTDDYPVAFRIIHESPLFGHGIFTFVPTIYVRILDNQWLDFLIELGYVGTAAVALLFVVAFFTARGARRATCDEELRDLAQCLAGSVAGLALSYGTFDALGFPMATSLTFLLIGACGAIWRVARLAPNAPLAQEPAVLPRPRMRMREKGRHRPLDRSRSPGRRRQHVEPPQRGTIG